MTGLMTIIQLMIMIFYSIIKMVVLEVIGTEGREGMVAVVSVEPVEASIGFRAGLMFNSMALRLLSAAKCLLTCLVKWSLLMNLRSHMLHTNFFSPV